MCIAVQSILHYVIYSSATKYYPVHCQLNIVCHCTVYHSALYETSGHAHCPPSLLMNTCTSSKGIKPHFQVACYMLNVFGGVLTQFLESGSVIRHCFPALLHHCKTVHNNTVRVFTLVIFKPILYCVLQFEQCICTKW